MNWPPETGGMMESAKRMIRENDAVELLEAVEAVDADGSWPAGTIGTVISEHGQWKLVEIADKRGVTLDYVSVAEPRLKLVVNA
jgi:hypothetical protein